VLLVRVDPATCAHCTSKEHELAPIYQTKMMLDVRSKLRMPQSCVRLRRESQAFLTDSRRSQQAKAKSV
jgi:hypothetical protein